MTSPGQPPNMRLKLSTRGGRLKGTWSILSAAAAGRSLSAIRYTAGRRPAQAMALAISLGLAPTLNSARTSRSTDTVGSAASIFATRD